MTHILDKQAAEFKHLEAQIHEIRHHHEAKLWHQVAEDLAKYIDEPCLAQGQHVLDLYNQFVYDFENKIDQIVLISIACAASDQFSNCDDAVNFLTDVTKRTDDVQAKTVGKLKVGLHYLKNNRLDAGVAIIDENSSYVENESDLDSIVYSHYYLLRATFNSIKKNYEEFYKYGLQYLAYTQETKINAQQKVNVSVEMAYAVLVSDRIYNFSELLEQPVFKALETTEHEWVYQLIKTFNTGDLAIYENTVKKYDAQIQGSNTLSNNRKNLNEKIRILAFLEKVFSLPKNDRTLSFGAIAQVTGLAIDTVEPLIMRTMSLKLVKGAIDEIDQSVRIDWIIPRVLDVNRIGIMKDKIEDWTNSLETLIKLVEAEGQNNA